MYDVQALQCRYQVVECYRVKNLRHLSLISQQNFSDVSQVFLSLPLTRSNELDSRYTAAVCYILNKKLRCTTQKLFKEKLQNILKQLNYLKNDRYCTVKKL